MAGYTSNREENVEVKYLRKVLRQVDDRVQVPQSLNAQSLRALIEDVEPATPRDWTRRPRWLSLQSGIAYAAAFALIVALFYSMELYKPEIINGGLRIAETEKAPSSVPASETPEFFSEESDTFYLPDPVAEAGGQEDVPETLQTGAVPAAVSEDTANPRSQPLVLGVGGSGKSELLLEQGGYEYRWRSNDISDPDRPGPVTLEIIGKESQELVSQVDITDLLDIRRCFVYEDTLLLVGAGGEGVAVLAYQNPLEPDLQSSITQPGTFVDANFFKGVAHVVSLSEESPGNGEVVELPNAESPEACVVTSVDLGTLETSQKAFAGAKGTVQLHNLNAYIHYEGKDGDGLPKDYIGQILLDGTDIELGTVS